MIFLKLSTSATISFGPAVANTDGVTLVTNLVGTGANQFEHTSSGIQISKNGAAMIARSATATASVYRAYGMYQITLSTTDTNTLGVLRVSFSNAAAVCPMWIDIMIQPALVYDTFFAASGGATFPAATLASTTNITAGTITTATTATNVTTVNGLAANVITAASIATAAITEVKIAADAITASKIATDAIAGAKVAADAVTKIQAGLATPTNITAGTITTVTNLTNAATNGDLTATMKASVNTEADTALTDYDPPTQTELLAAHATTDGLVTTVDTVVDAVKAKTDSLTFTVAGVVDANTLRIDGVAAAAARLALSAGVITPGTVDTTGFAATATEFESDDITEATAEHYKGRVIIFTSGVLLGQATSISVYALATGRGHFTVVALTEAPGNNDTFVIV